MWSSSVQEKNPRSNNQTRAVSSSSSSWSSHSSSSSSTSWSSHSSSSSSTVLCSRRRNMEEVWRDINIPPPSPISIPHCNPTTTSCSSYRGMILQDFLAGPTKETTAAAIISLAPPMAHSGASEVLAFPLPPTALSLNSGLCFDYHSASGNCSFIACNNRQQQQKSEAFDPPPVVVSSPPSVGLFSCCPGSKRVLDNSNDSFGDGDIRQKRMMKNRESAARSRARKQAYTTELELEISHMAMENEKLRKQCEELRLAMAAQHSVKKTIQRTLTAPF